MVFPCHLVKANQLVQAISHKQSLKELGTLLVQRHYSVLSGQHSVFLDLSVNCESYPRSFKQDTLKLLFSHCSLLKGPSFAYQPKTPCQEEEARPPWRGTQRWTGRAVDKVAAWKIFREEDDHHFHCRWHPNWNSSMPKFLLQGVKRHLTAGRS